MTQTQFTYVIATTTKMEKVTVYLFDTNNKTSEELKGSVFLLEKDLEELNRFKVEEVEVYQVIYE